MLSRVPLLLFRPDVSAHVFLHGESENNKKVFYCSCVVKRTVGKAAFCEIQMQLSRLFNYAFAPVCDYTLF